MSVLEALKQTTSTNYDSWTVREFFEFYDILKLAGLLEHYKEVDPSFKRIANRLYNLFTNNKGVDSNT